MLVLMTKVEPKFIPEPSKFFCFGPNMLIFHLNKFMYNSTKMLSKNNFLSSSPLVTSSHFLHLEEMTNPLPVGVFLILFLIQLQAVIFHKAFCACFIFFQVYVCRNCNYFSINTPAETKILLNFLAYSLN